MYSILLIIKKIFRHYLSWLSFASYLGFKGEVDESLPAPRLCKFPGVDCHFCPKWICLVLYDYLKEQYGRQPKANVTHANSCFVSHVLGADKKWSGSQGNRVKGFCVLLHCMSSPFNFAWSLCCLNPSFFKLGVARNSKNYKCWSIWFCAFIVSVFLFFYFLSYSL